MKFDAKRTTFHRKFEDDIYLKDLHGFIYSVTLEVFCRSRDIVTTVAEPKPVTPPPSSKMRMEIQGWEVITQHFLYDCSTAIV